MKRIFRSPGQEIIWQLLAMALLIAALVEFSSGLGYMRISFSDVLRIVLAKLLGMNSLLDGVNSLFPVVISEVRLSRLLTAVLVGAGLALSGVEFQGILLNPLPDPYTTGSLRRCSPRSVPLPCGWSSASGGSGPCRFLRLPASA